MTHAADRNLLFGILALQMDFISRDALVAAMHAWVLDKRQGLGSILEVQKTMAGDARALVEALVDKHLEFHGGDVEKSLASLTPPGSVQDELGQIADAELQASLPRIAAARTPRHEQETPTLVGRPTSEGTRFRVLRPHARGGLGEVYVAHDAELHREVALKEIQGRHADDRESRARFVLEAEITGGLEHPGVVPVYGLGFYKNGRPFYAMRFVRGDSLKDAIARFHARRGTRAVAAGDSSAGGLPGALRREADGAEDGSAGMAAPGDAPDDSSGKLAGTGGRAAAAPADAASLALEFRKLLGRFVDVCDAIEYAHSRGVLHRDLKPGNIMLGRYGETLVVDWGLAKPMGVAADAEASEAPLRPSSASGSAETLPGAAVGTPGYMSPEQAAGRLDLLGPASDVYSLGATLYSLLTGRPAFERKNLEELLKKVQEGDFAPPRAVDPDVPRALDAVCLKAMALNPLDRYASPRALADEVERWLANEPVEAWPEPWNVRARRWLSRHQTTVSTAVATVVVAAVSLALAAVLLARANGRERMARETAQTQRQEARKQRDTARRQEREARKQRDRAEANFILAHQAVNRYLDQVSEDRLLNEPGLQALRRELLATALEFYQKFVSQDERPGRKADLANAYLRLGDITRETGSASKAARFYSDAIKIFEELASANPDDTVYQRALARAYSKLGVMHQLEHRLADAQPLLEKARALWQNLDGERSAQAVNLTLRGAAAASSGQTEAARAAYREALAIQEQLIKDHPDEGREQMALATTCTALANTLKQDDPREAERLLTRALDIFNGLAGKHPGELEYQNAAAVGQSILGAFYAETGRHQDACAAQLKALQVFEKLSKDNPNAADYRLGLAEAHRQLGIAQQLLGQLEEGEASLLAALAARQRLVDDDPELIIHRSNLAATQTNLGLLYAAMGRLAEAEAAHQAALDVRLKLASDDPGQPQHTSDVALSHTYLGAVHQAGGEPQRAEKDFQLGIELRNRLYEANRTPTTAINLAAAHTALGVFYIAAGRPGDALAAHRRALEVREALAAEHPDVPQYQSELAVSHGNIALAHQAAGQAEQADKAYQRALAIYQSLNDEHPSAGHEGQLAMAEITIGSFYQQLGRWPQAEASWDRARAMLDKLVREEPSSVVYRRNLALTHNNLGLLYASTARTAEARKAYDRSLAIRRQLVEEYPDAVDLRTDLSQGVTNSAALHQLQGELEQAETTYRELLAIHERLANDFPHVPSYSSQLIRAHQSMATFYQAANQTQPAEAQLEQALARCQRFVARFPEVVLYRHDLGLVHYSLGLLQAGTARPELAVESFRRAREIQQAISAAHPSATEYRGALVLTLANMAVPLQTLERWADAEQALELSQELCQQLADEQPSNPANRYALASSWTNLGRLRFMLGETAAAQKDFDRAMEICARLVREQPAAVLYQREWGVTRGNQGYLLLQENRVDEAAAACREALGVQELLWRAYPQMYIFGQDLGLTYGNTAYVFKQRQDHQTSLEWFDKAITILEEVIRLNANLPDARRALGDALAGRADGLAHLDRHSDALKLLDRALELDVQGNRDEWVMMRWGVAANLGNYPQAVDEAEKVMAAWKESPLTRAVPYAAACLYGAAVRAAAKDQSLADPQRAELVEKYAARALELLERSKAVGHFNLPYAVSQFRTAPDLAPLRDRAEFRQFEAELMVMPSVETPASP